MESRLQVATARVNEELRTGKRVEYWLKNLRKVEQLGCDPDNVLPVDDETHKPRTNYVQTHVRELRRRWESHEVVNPTTAMRCSSA
jgi:hypothetical protein